MEKGDVDPTLPEVCKSYVAFSPQQQQQVEQPVEQVLLMLQDYLTVGLFHLYQTETKHCNEGLVYTTPEKFQNAAQFISTVYKPTVHTNPSRKRSSKWKNLKTLAFRFSADGKNFEGGAFENDDVTIS